MRTSGTGQAQGCRENVPKKRQTLEKLISIPEKKVKKMSPGKKMVTY